ncbi:cytochrome d ubiquinol oxidase subunit II [Thiothrix nivea]|uniref:Cytochrome bd ubiquinol oxidase subunit II n=1 Tax=Thiothrix nivea (strain ATCC 35100 / DSM 5205 / JP2) TaxID=870187 RepID=A0A656HNJ7_THINJ|nr:cytochrome d ubiquinol oxidase subunit II [Thiothrix nivea]EIJ36920.1 cytochrome bd ubiquinol oxidase subunit II [Thiothrix nivea DSM 5205]
MNELHAFLATVWFVLLGLVLALYVMLDGFELGVGILSLLNLLPKTLTPTPLPEGEGLRTAASCPPSTSGRGGWGVRVTGLNRLNEIWLLLAGMIMLGAFPPAFALIASSLRLPLALLLAGLLLRRAGVIANRHQRKPGLAHGLYGWGSLLAAIAQGLVLGAVCCGGLPAWVSPASCLIGVGVVLFYLLLGVCYQHGRRSLLFAGLGLFLLAFSALATWLYPDIIPGRLALGEAAASNQTLLSMILGISLLLPVILAYNGFQYLLSSKPSGQHDNHKTPPAA